MAFVILAMLLSAGVTVLAPWPMKILVDYVLNGDPAPERVARLLQRLPHADSPTALVTWCVGATLVLYLLGWAIETLSAFANMSFGQRMVYDLAGDVYAHLQRLPSSFHARRSSGDLIRRVTVDCGALATIVRDALLPVIGALLSLTAMFFVMWRLDWMLTLMALSVLPYMAVVFCRYATPMSQSGYEQQEHEGRLYDLVEETLTAMPVVQAFSREHENDHQLRRSAANVLTATMATTRLQLRFKILMGLATAVGTAGILWLGASRALSGQMSVGDMLVFLAYLGALYAPLETVLYTSSTIHGAAGSVTRVLEVLHTPLGIADRPGATALDHVRGHVRFEDVSFWYRSDRLALKQISLEALPGEMIAIVGPSGAGKTTLANLLPRFIEPDSGRVTIDGHDVRDLKLASLRRNVAMVQQDPFLFPLTIAENIAYGRPGASRTEIEEAARAAQAHAFIEALSNGYDTVIGERGATISVGERQRIAIARALLTDAPILILDEPTSALDAEREAMLVEAIERLAAGRTTLIIAHRFSTIRRAHRIVVIEDGCVVQVGRHDELLRRGGLYARLHAIQAGEAAF